MDKFQAVIIKSSRREFLCQNSSTREEFHAKAKGNLLKKDANLVVGDLVDITYDSGLDEYIIIIKLHERRNFAFRRIIRENKIKPIASNLDVLLIVCTVSQPEYKRGMLDRYILRAYQWQIPTCIIFNKIDQDFHEDLDLEFEISRLSELDLSFYCISAHEPKLAIEGYGNLESLREFLKNKTALFLGQSGVGKSKIISAMSNQKFELPSQAIGKVGKGTHTTTWTELIEFEEFKVIDSPGVRTLSIQDIMIDELDDLFPDLQHYSNQCKFKNCNHQDHSHKCRFYEDDISHEVLTRLESYLRMKGEIEEIPNWKK